MSSACEFLYWTCNMWDRDVEGELAGLTGESRENVRMILCLLACFPVAAFHRCILFGRNASLQHLYFFLTGLSLHIFFLRWDSLHFIVPSLATYALLVLVKPCTFRSLLIFAGPMGHLVWGYVYMGADTYYLGWMAAGCVNCQSLFALDMDLKDGQLPDEKKNADQKKYALARAPSLLEYLGYKFNPLSSQIGPMINFRDYNDFVLAVHVKDFDHKKYSLTAEAIKATLWALAEAVVAFVGMTAGGLVTPSSLFLSDAFLEYNIASRYAVLGLHTAFNLAKPIFAWKILEAAACLATLSYSGTNKDGPQFELCCQGYFWQLLMPYNLSMYSVKFNCATHRFVKRYIFKRLAFLGSWYASLLLTLIYLAIWHGIHFGYMWTFPICELPMLYVEGLYIPIVKNITGIYCIDSLPLLVLIPVRVLCAIYTYLFLAYGFMGMAFLNATDVFYVAGSFYYYCHVICAILAIVHFVVPASLKKLPESASAAAKKKTQ